MKKLTITIIAIAALLLVFAWSSYNNLVVLNQQVEGQWAQVEAQYQRRFDLIPNLVQSVKGILTQEKEVFGQIAQARTKYSAAIGADQRAKAANEVESTLGRLLMIVENYPQLKSSETM